MIDVFDAANGWSTDEVAVAAALGNRYGIHKIDDGHVDVITSYHRNPRRDDDEVVAEVEGILRTLGVDFDEVRAEPDGNPFSSATGQRVEVHL